LLPASSFAGLIDTLYVTDGDASRLARIDNVGPAVITTTHSGGYPIAVRNSIWIGNYYGSGAREYNLAGVFTGNTAPLSDINAVDGAVNGNINYALGNAFNSTATVYVTNPDWTNPVALFSVSGTDMVGITFDPVSGHIWVSGGTTIFEYTTTGAFVSLFSHSSGRGSLAYEASTDTLWFVRNGSNVIDQYSKTGSLLQSLNIANLASNNWGAEFETLTAAPVPEPTSMVVWGLGMAGAVGAAWCRRRKKPRAG
jgi:hypothetical protein